jgi:transcriptional regulator NrdR family protein
MTNPGAALQSLRRRVEKTCPVCGETFTGYEYAVVCRKPACKSALKRLKAKANKKAP